MTLGHPRVVGWTCGIAAYKVVTVIQRLVERRCDVHVIASGFVLDVAETARETFLETVASKAKSKGVSLMVGNLVSPETRFGNTVADIVLVDSSGATVSDFHGTKVNAANHILDYVSRQRAATS
jgi:phosphopantothenoylcysteine synthetase/decarboxylase